MRRILGNVMPVGAPWGGPESSRFPSCFASLAMYLDKFSGSDDDRKREHGGLYHLYITVSGIGVGTVWDDDLRPDRHLSPVVGGEEDSIAWSMRYAGYRYRAITSGAPGGDREAMRKSIVDSIDRDVPVLMSSTVGPDWCIVAGYDQGGDTLIGWYENWYSWLGAAPTPDDYLGNGMFLRKSWHETVSRVFVVDGSTARDVTYREVLGNLISTLEKRWSMGYRVGFEASDQATRFLRDDGWFTSADPETLCRAYGYVHSFVGSFAEARWCASRTFACSDCDDRHVRSGLEGEAPCSQSLTFAGAFHGEMGSDAPRLLRSVARDMMDTHDVCWDAWRAMGRDHRCEPERYAEAFRSREVREKVARSVEAIAENDRKMLLVLKAL